MTLLTPHKLLPFLLITSTLLLGGCGKKSVDAPDAPVANSVPEGEASAAASEPELPKADYWKPVAGYLAGSYSGACLNPAAAAKRIAGKALIAADGKYTFNEFSGDVLTSEQTLFGRKHDANGSTSLIFNTMGQGSLFGLMTGENGQGSIANFGKEGGSSFACDPSKDPIGMAGKPLYTVFASVLESAPRKISCMVAASMKMSDLAYQFKDGVLKIDDQTYDLSKMDEMVTIRDSFETLSYTATTDNTRSVSVALDKHGKIMLVTAGGKDGMLYSCNKD